MVDIYGAKLPSPKGNKMNTYTELENEVIEGFRRKPYTHEESGKVQYFSSYSFFDNGYEVDSDTWADIFIEECGDPKIYRGVISSLIKKGFFYTTRPWDNEVGLHLTELAIEELQKRGIC